MADVAELNRLREDDEVTQVSDAATDTDTEEDEFDIVFNSFSPKPETIQAVFLREKADNQGVPPCVRRRVKYILKRSAGPYRSDFDCGCKA